MQMRVGGSREGKRMPCQSRDLVFPRPFLSPLRVKHLIKLFTYNAATGGIIKESVLILDVVPRDTEKAEG